jgi:predicted kinase
MLHLLCGKIASGKSTFAQTLGAADATVIIAEDDWLAALYADEMKTVADYVRCSAKLRGMIGAHIVSLLKAGVSVVLDFPANTIENRKWMLDIARVADVAHTLHVLDVPDEICKERLRKRNENSEHPFEVSDEQFAQISRHFTTPSVDEGFDIELHRYGK